MRELEEKCKECVCSDCDCNNALHSTETLNSCYGCDKDVSECKPVKKEKCLYALKHK